jgi:5'-3' exonuclease
MIILDYNGIAVGAVLAQKAEVNEDLIRHIILNQIRLYNHKFRDDYGQMVIACEGGSWRKEVFPQYKAVRKKSRDNDDMDWDTLFKIINQVTEDLKNNFPYKVIKVRGAEADDIIGTLAEETQEFGKHEPVMIISADKDFLQLQKYDNVRQFSPMQKKFLTEPNPRKYLFEHILKGDSGDGVPNCLSGDNVFVDSIRQSPVTKKKLEQWLEVADDLENNMDYETYRNYLRNKKMIDLAEAPASLKQEIINTYENSKTAPKMKVLNYLIKKRCKQLIECVEEFH